MTVTYFTQSKKNPAGIYIRIREGKFVDAKAKTKFIINPDLLVKGVVKFPKNPPNISAQEKLANQELTNSLIILQKGLNDLKIDVTNHLNNRKDYEIINSTWLKNVINPEDDGQNVPNDLIGYFEYYLDCKKSSLKSSTLKKLKVFMHRIENFQKKYGRIYIQEINKKFSLSMQKWCDDNGYAHNTKVKTLKVILTVCNHALDNQVPAHPELSLITKNLEYEETENITLSFEELERIIKTKIKDARLNAAKDWLIISCYTAQRVSDFLRFTKDDVVIKYGQHLLDIRQKKTDEDIYIPLNEEVLTILRKRNGNFPPTFSSNQDSNSAIYNVLIKEVGKIAGITKKVTAKVRNPKTNRYESKVVPKYEAITSHIGRRSFATNYYGEIETSLLISATGHSTEGQFLRYVGKKGPKKAILLAKGMRDLKERRAQEEIRRNESSLNVIRNLP
ncbi:site-specific integrase [Lutimonas zeaxanthinifaciens]|uniref:site-specific integrase n=1 Tax=Lutimonas zeaxanthinifaciens TaxID=3060215 RepID=UPI00265CE931|nr:site-specific integrase [Lutimonas sp. YSD2104]WKK66509.1 phage integrase SAM-like domain-containing protein [Lutimonas sp. YSD2104]